MQIIPMSGEHGRDIIDIFNHYIENSFAAYPENPVPYEFFGKFLEMTKNYPAYTVVEGDKVIGFGFLRPYSPFSSFRETAEITYFIHKNHTGKGIGKIILGRLKNDAAVKGIRIILASIASENTGSLKFHRLNGFAECGRFPGVVNKNGRVFDVVYMMTRVEKDQETDSP